MPERYPFVMENVRLGFYIRRSKLKDNPSAEESTISRETVLFPFETATFNDVWPCVKKGNIYEIILKDTDLEASILNARNTISEKAEWNLRNTDGFFYVCPVIIFDGNLIDLCIEGGLKNYAEEDNLGDTFLPGALRWLPSHQNVLRFEFVIDPSKGQLNLIYEAIGRHIVRTRKQLK